MIVAWIQQHDAVVQMRMDLALTDPSPGDTWCGRVGVSDSLAVGTMNGFYGRYGKRAFDVVGATLLIVFVSPLYAALILAVRLKLGAPVFFVQRRGGYRGRVLHMTKFRSMTGDRDHQGRLLPDSMRLTRFGRLIRAWSLDELPQLVHVLKGEMSLVGPRPFVINYMAHYTPEQMRRHEVRPGMTGLAQVNGRNALNWDEKFAYDLAYIDQMSLWLDLKILWRTLGVLAMGDGQPAQAFETQMALQVRSNHA